MTRRARAIFVGALLATACHRTKDPFDVPLASDIEYVHVTLWKGLASVKDYKIWDRPGIEAILAQIKINNDGYIPQKRNQPQDFSVAFCGYNSVPLILQIGPDWFGGIDLRHKDDGYRQRPLSTDERRTWLAVIAEP